MEPVNLMELDGKKLKEFLNSFDYVLSDCDGELRYIYTSAVSVDNARCYGNCRLCSVNDIIYVDLTIRNCLFVSLLIHGHHYNYSFISINTIMINSILF